ncbi:MAG: hypothetical protein Kow00108_21480 [Calditrichia bacterium]
MKYVRTVSLIIALLVPLWGQPQSYSLEELIKKAQQHDYQVRQLSKDQKILSLRHKQLKSTWLPELNANAGYQHQSRVPVIQLSFMPGNEIQAGVHDQYNFSLKLQHLVFDGFSRIWNSKIIKTQLKESEFKTQYRKQDIRFQITFKGYQIKLLELSHQTIRASLKRLKYQQDKIKALYAQGLSASLDTLEVASRIREMTIGLIELESNRRQLLADLEQMCGLSRIDSIMIDSPQPTVQTSVVSNTPIPIEENLQMKLLKFKSELIGYQKKSTTSSFLPTITFFTSLNYGKPGLDFFRQEWMDYWLLGVNISWNIWRWGRDKQEMQMNTIRLQQVELQRRETEEVLQAQIQKYRTQLRELEQKQLIYETLVQEKQEKYDLFKKHWEQGQKDILEVLDAEQELTSYELKVKQNKLQSTIVYLLLDQLSGFTLSHVK